MGSGKSNLLSAFAGQEAARGARVLLLDCRTVEPTIGGLLGAVGDLLDATPDEPGAAAAAISNAGERVFLAFDNYQVFRLVDSWLRREFIPLLAENVRIVLASREPPTAGWVSAANWRPLFETVELESTPAVTAETLYQAISEAPANPKLQEALEAASVVRRMTRPMLSALVPDADGPGLFDALARLPFVDRTRHGLALQDRVRRLLKERLQSEDPQRHRDCQRAAWTLLREQLRDAPRADLWRYTADVIYLIENPVIREAFFPSQSPGFSVEPAVEGDRERLMEIARRHEPAPAVQALELWWRHLPSAFHVVRDPEGTLAGFYCMAGPDELDADWMQRDPVARAWQGHLPRRGDRGRCALFLRRWLSLEEGEAPSAVQAAAWVDIKRTYLELRPELRRVYLTLQDPGPYGSVASQLGFQVLDELAVPLESCIYRSAMLDFGPRSVDGWICDLLAAELGVTEDRLLDSAARELVCDGRRIALTPLEYGVASLLESRAGQAVSREELLNEVWGRQADHSSNVVDAVVRGLRKKCGPCSDLFETVRGVGYRLRVQG